MARWMNKRQVENVQFRIIKVAQKQLKIDFWWLQHIGGATRVFAGAVGEHKAVVPLGYFLFELVVERCNIHISLVELMIKYC